MKKTINLSLAICLILNQITLANESIFNTPPAKEEPKKETNTSLASPKKYDSLIEFNADKKNLDYLFNNENINMKFPIDDYIYKGGFKEANQNVYEAYQNELNGTKSLEQSKAEAEAEFRKNLQKELLAQSGNKKGNIMVDENGNILRDANGNPMYDNIMYNENGYPILDANGNPRYKDVLYNENGYPIYDKNGNIILKKDPQKGNVLLDKNGKPVLDSNNNPMYDNILYDKNSKPILDKNGNIILKKDPQKGNVLLDKNGKPLLDCNGNAMYENVLYDSANCPVLNEKGNIVLKSNSKAKELLRKQEIVRDPEKYLQEEIAKVLAKQNNLSQYNNPQAMQNQARSGSSSSVGGRNINSLIRDSILADRGTAPTGFSNPTSKYGNSSFSNQENVDNATNEHKLFRTLRAGRLIPAILTTAISSDIEGLVTAQVEQDVYASMGKAVLIPRGSKVIGTYKNDNKIGQNRMSIAWREIITPQGVNILLTNAIASDNMGMSGAIGDVNNKYLERYGVGYGLSTISNVLMLAMAAKAGGNIYAQEIYNQSNEDITKIVEDIMEQQSQIKPTIEIKQGSRIYIVPSAHIWFPVPKNGEVMAEFFNE
ncbi:DNA type IV secretion system protein ComB10 [Campylobacter sp. MIT 97-5078]|uniref:DNA type IV secretion system protein ComB10 n=1 Tax=Campylobacter sp. MIT 97-5078 TaxID=1548153 RepID=UPI000AED4A06|nr:DNA type IV secretion system protein ComB10 [Campylobacter sp. MIT 97-5078]